MIELQLNDFLQGIILALIAYVIQKLFEFEKRLTRIEAKLELIVNSK